MSNTPLSMNKLRMIIRMYCQGMGIRSISWNARVSRNTVKKYLRIWATLNLEHQEFSLKSDSELSVLFSATESVSVVNARQEELEKLLPAICKRLKKRGVTRQDLHKEYIAAHPDGFSITMFRVAIQRYVKMSHPVMHLEHKAGDKLFVDYAGDKLTLKLADGTARQVEVFVAILPCSQLTYVEAVESQKKADFIRACEHAFHYFGGVPQAIVPDNLKSAVTKASRYEAVLNEEFSCFAEHYGVTPYPARGYKPRDKALVENAVKLTYKDIYTKIEALQYRDLASLNLAILSALEMHNNQPLTGKSFSRREYFEDIERDALAGLNPLPYQIRTHVMATVMKDSHVRLGEDTHHYSVPHSFVGKKVKLSYSSDRVDIYYQYTLIASHDRCGVPYKYTTNKEHLAPQHRFVLDWTPEKFIEQAAEIHPDVEHYIKQVLQKKRYADQAHKCCSGILSFARKVGTERLRAACVWADNIGKYNYLIIEEILSKKLDQLEPEIEILSPKIPQHENIRGKDYYQ